MTRLDERSRQCETGDSLDRYPAIELRRDIMAERELIDTGRDKRYVRRDDKGQFSESDDVGKSLAQDVRQPSETKVKSGQGDRGDH